MRNSFLIIVLLFDTVMACAQQPSDKPEVGKPLPDIHFDNVLYYPKRSVSLKEFRGKWLFLDFWYTGCNSDVKSLQDVDRLQKQFNNDIQFFMVCINQKQYHSEFAFTRLTEHYKYTLPAAFDSTLHVRWGIWTVPCMIVVDPAGIVRGITDGEDVTAATIRDVIDGKNPSFHEQYNGPRYDVSKFPGTVDSTLVYRFILTKWRGESGGTSNLDTETLPPHEIDRGIQAVRISLANLYELAYWGHQGYDVTDTPQGLVYPLPVIEVSNDSLFRNDSPLDEEKHFYNVNLAIPYRKDHGAKAVKQVLQRELKNAFGYEVVVEKRKMEVWRLIAKPGAIEKVKTKGGAKKIFSSPAGLDLQNAPISFFCERVIYQLSSPDRIFINKNETGYEGNIDIRIDAIMTDFNDTQAELKKHGFEIIKDTAEMSVIVIKDTSYR